MPTVQEIERYLYELAPKSGAMEWDNVGLLVGNPEAEVSRVLVALDITLPVVAEAVAKGCQLIVSHHPVMNCTWQPVQSVRTDDPQGQLLTQLIQANVAAICMHTNLDVAVGGVNDCLATVLELVDPGPLGDPEGLCRMGTLPQPMPIREFAQFVCRRLGSNGVRYSDAGKPVSRVAIGGGACGDYEPYAIAAGCDTFVTADLKYHQMLDSVSKGINLMDAGHFPTEDPVCPMLVAYLSAGFSNLSVSKSTVHKEIIEYYVEGE